MPRRVNSGPMGGMFGRRREQNEQQDDWHQEWRQGSASRPAHDYVLDHDVNLARWFRQVGLSTTPQAMEQLAARPEYSALILQMKRAGQDLRIRALQQIGHIATTADPTVPVQVRTRLVLEAAWAGLDGYPHGPILPKPWAISHENGMIAFRERLFEQCGMVPYAYVLTYPDGMPPALHYDFAAGRLAWQVDGQYFRHPRVATLHAAMCLGILYRDYDWYRSQHNPGGIIVPPNPMRFDRAITVPVHGFMRALLGLGESCPPRFGCACNRVLWQIHESVKDAAARVQGADDTDMLPPYEVYQPQMPQHYYHTPPHEQPAIRSAPLSELHGRPPNRSTPIVPEHHRDEDDGVPDETPLSDQESDGWGRGV